MNKTRLRNILLLALWLITATGFLVTVLTDGGPATYADDAPRRVIGAVFLALGIFGAPLIRVLTRIKAGDDHIERDERDAQIEAKATGLGLLSVMMILFLGCIWLWETYQEAGCVPVGWMWVIAYGALILSHLAPAIAAFCLDFGVWRDGES